jgi:hypothetical protein|tara:strand:- start:1707 stop:1922 length:216 start_codon:yes stop_codon:yes gene_type:complete
MAEKMEVTLARIEERIKTLFVRMDNHEISQEQTDKKIDKLAESAVKSAMAERMFWICITAGVGSLIYYMQL